MAFILHGVLQMFGFGSGLIKGKGKGTDDAVKMGLQKGAYVMPADSTEQIGAEQLGALGKGFVPAHVSNGEYHLPPEQVHGLGVQVLDAMKNATHKPVPDKQGLGFGVYFANGGVVDDENQKKDWFKHTNAHIKKMGQELAGYSAKDDTIGEAGARTRAIIGAADNLRRDRNSALFDVVKGAGEGAYEGWKQGSKQAAMNHSVSGLGGLGFGHTQQVTGDSAGGRFFKGLFDLDDKPKLLGFIDLDDKPNQQSTTQPSATQAAPKQQERKPVATESTNTPKLPPVSQESLTPKIATSADGKSAEQIRAENRALGFASPQSRPNVTPQSDAKGYLVGDSKGISFAPDFNQGFATGVADTPKGQPFVGVIGETPDPRKSAAWRAASTPHAGAQNRQLTANQINAMRGMLADDERNQVALQQTAMNNAAQSANAQANNQAALQREAMQQQGALMRDGINQASQDRRLSMQQAQQQGQFDVANAFNERKQANQEQLDAIKIEQAKRLQNLQNALLSAQSDADKSAIAKQIAMLNGEFKSSDGFNPDQYTKLKRTMMGEDGMPIENEDVIDLRTGKSILAGSQPPLQAGVVIDGYRFKGGNPNDTKNWEEA